MGDRGYQEGLRIAPVRLFTAAGPERESIDLVLSNVRGREEREGDILAQFAANDVAARRLAELVERYGADTLRRASSGCTPSPSRRCARRSRRCPTGSRRGRTSSTTTASTTGRSACTVRVEIRGDEATFDFTGTAPQARGPVNTTYFIACSAVYYAMKALAAPDVPPNDGCYRPLKVIVPRGTVLNAARTGRWSAATTRRRSAWWTRSSRRSRPSWADRVSAGGPTTAGLMIFGARGRTAAGVSSTRCTAGARAPRASKDGASAMRVHMSNVMNTPVEVIEDEYPFAVEEQALRAGSGGDGAHRGGLGFRRAYRVIADEV